ncbi:actin-like protein arp8 [Coemansia sp. RSA 988]|nr:actin-like protein arp8 [Coemansia sp. RSA 988]
MSNGKRKKYSWLPESNPSALSGDPIDNTDKTPKPTRVRSKSGKGRPKDKNATTETNPAVDALGISTPGEQLQRQQSEQDLQYEQEAMQLQDNDNAVQTESTSTVLVAEPENASAVDSTSTAQQSANPSNDSGAQGTSTVNRRRRRSRKDSVDDLVRSRFITNMAAQSEGQRGDATQTSPSFKHTADNPPPMSAITANVRDALEHERSAARPSAAIASPIGGKSRNGHGRFGRISNGAADIHSSTNPFTSAPPRLRPIESKYSFPTYQPLGNRNVGSSMRRGDRGVGSFAQHGSFDATTGENVIVIHPGSRWLRIGRASDAVPREIPHLIARRLKVRPSPATADPVPSAEGFHNAANAVPSNSGSHVTANGSTMEVDNTSSTARDADTDEGKARHNIDGDADGKGVPSIVDQKSDAMDVDLDGANDSVGRNDSNGGEDEDENEDDNNSLDSGESEDHAEPKESDAVEETLTMLRTALKQHQRLSKRKVAPNAYSQVLTYNRRATPEMIHDHNDPFRIEWLSSSEIKEDPVVGEEALRIADPDDFLIRYPIRNGCFNVEEYASIEEVLGDIEAIWSHAIEAELKINKRDLAGFGVVLAIPDIYNRLEVILLAEVLLRRIGFQQLLVQQSSALVTFGAGFSSACVVDVGAQKTSICCVEDGYCAQESRVTTMYGGDDITRFLFSLFMRSKFPYREASLQRMHDWNMMNELRERFCTLNLSDVNIRLHNFFVRLPDQQTRKYSFKTYDEGYQAPLCLFYPAIIDAYYQPPDYSRSFLNAYYPEAYGEAKVPAAGVATPSQFGILPSHVAVTGQDPVVTDVQPLFPEPATAPATVPATEPGTPNIRSQSAAPSQLQPNAMSSAVKEKFASENLATAHTSPATPAASSNNVYISDPQAQYARIPLDAAITHSIVHAGSIDRAKKLYTSIVVVGGGVYFISGFNDLLSDRLMYMRPAYLQSVERVDIVSAPRDLDPRVLVWKGGAVLSRLDCAKEMWLSSKDWTDFGPKLLRDRVLFQW